VRARAAARDGGQQWWSVRRYTRHPVGCAPPHTHFAQRYGRTIPPAIAARPRNPLNIDCTSALSLRLALLGLSGRATDPPQETGSQPSSAAPRSVWLGPCITTTRWAVAKPSGHSPPPRRSSPAEESDQKRGSFVTLAACVGNACWWRCCGRRRRKFPSFALLCPAPW
jgi:hypothetical protein